MSKSALAESEEIGFAPTDEGPRSQVRGSLNAARHQLRKRLTQLHIALDRFDAPFQRDRAFGILEEILFDVTNEFSEEEMLLIKHSEERWHAHRASHEELLSALHAVKRAGLRCPDRENLRDTVDAIAEWLVNHFRTVDVRDEGLMRS